MILLLVGLIALVTAAPPTTELAVNIPPVGENRAIDPLAAALVEQLGADQAAPLRPKRGADRGGERDATAGLDPLR